MMEKKVILITGASSGIGLHAAVALAKAGYTVYGAARRLGNMQPLVDHGGYALALDLHDESSVLSVVNEIISQHGRIDVLWNNAAYGEYGSVEHVPVESARKQFEVNLFGLAALTQRVIPVMKQAGKGLIINTSSAGGVFYSPLGAWYHASKHALEGFSDCLRYELKPFGIDVVILQPGSIDTDFANTMSKPLVESSKGTDYQQMAEEFNNKIDEMYGNPKLYSSCDVVTDTILTILKEKKPKTRYAIGKNAKLLIFLRRCLSDRMFDRVVDGMRKK